MSERYIEYAHYGRMVSVREDLKGKHSEYCLCYKCSNFIPEDREYNCRIANLIYAVCVNLDLILPVWACPEFRDKNNECKCT